MRRHRRRWVWLYGIGMGLLVLVMACAPLAPGRPAPEVTVAPTEAAPATETVPPPATETALPAPTVTPRPTPTVIAVATTTPAPGALDLDWTSTSPDGQWTATAMTANLHEGESYFVRLRVEGSAGAQVWVPVDEWRPMGLGYTLPGLLQWSADGQRLYFTNVPHPDGCSLYVNGGDLQALDLATGQVTELMPEQALWLSLSPDETRVAYIGYGTRGLVIRDLATGQEQSVALERPVPDAPLGAIVWSPDGNALALTASHDVCGIDGVTSILHVDLATGAVRTLVEADARGFTTVAWSEPERIELVDSNNGIPHGLDVETGELVLPEVAGEFSIDWISTSPDGQWTASQSTTKSDIDALYRIRLTVVRSGGARTWMPVDEVRSGGLTGSHVNAVRWSDIGPAFFFSNWTGFDGCPVFHNGDDLYRLALDTGEVTQILPRGAVSIALSPSEKLLAYYYGPNASLSVMDVGLGTEKQVGLPTFVSPNSGDAHYPEEMFWSEDSTKIVTRFVQASCDEAAHYAVLVIDAQEGAAKTVIDNDPRRLTIVEWAEDGRVKLMDWDGGYWWLDMESGEVTPA